MCVIGELTPRGISDGSGRTPYSTCQPHVLLAICTNPCVSYHVTLTRTICV